MKSTVITLELVGGPFDGLRYPITIFRGPKIRVRMADDASEPTMVYEDPRGQTYAVYRARIGHKNRHIRADGCDCVLYDYEGSELL